MPELRFSHPFRRLQWRLTFSYVMVTVLGVVMIEIIGLAVLTHSIWPPIQDQLMQQTAVRASRMAVGMESVSPRSEILSALVNADDQDAADGDSAGSISIHMNEKLSVAVLDVRGHVMAASVNSPWPTHSSISARISSPEARILRAAQGEERPFAETTVTRSDRTVFAAAPIRGKGGKILGTLIAKLVVPYTTARLLKTEARLILPTALMVTLFAGIFGTIFGFLTARRLTSRLNGIAEAADSWSHGDFSKSAGDRSDDELGWLSRRLDVMAGKLQEHFKLREHLAAAEERNRLARDLHDTVKQQTFAASMHIGAAQSLLDKDAAARTHLDEASQLVHGVQQDLSTIIRELRPSAPDREDLETILRRYCSEWSRQTGIAVTVKIGPIRPASQAAREALLRIAQGALSNVARHSRASSAAVEIRSNDRNHLTLSIADDGAGFDPSAVVAEGIGLRVMRERAEALPSGKFHIQSSPGYGTRIEVETSLTEEDA